MKASYEELIMVDEIGEKIAESLTTFFLKKENIEIIEHLKAIGVQFELKKEELALKSNKLKNQSFVVSGVIQNFSRNELKKAIEENGGRNQSSVSSKTDFILAGENMGPGKKKKAKELGVKIISGVEFFKMLE